ncbi:tripartite tricarboxylate transporter permease [Chloroflexota bacterium]
MSGAWDGVKEVFRHKLTFIRGAAIGTGVGIIPGVGGGPASFIAYSATVQTSKHPETFGTGDPEGVLAPEASNNAKDGGALVPTLAFGIPGCPITAMLLGVFILHGIQPGPLFLRDHLDLVWVIIFGLVIANIFTSVIGVLVAPYLARITTVPVSYIAPIVLVLCATGAFATHGSIWDVALMMIAGAFGYGMSRFGFPVICLAIGYILGVIGEKAFHQSLQSNLGSYDIFFTRPISLVLIVLLIIVLLLPFINWFRTKKASKGLKEEEVKDVEVQPRKVYTGSFWFTVLILLIISVFVIVSFDYNVAARMIPLIIGITSLVLTILVLISARYPGLIKIFDISLTAVATGGKSDAAVASEVAVGRKVLTILAWIVGLFILVYMVGFLIAVPVFILLYIKFSGRKSWLNTLITAAIMGGFVYFGFEVMMRTDMFKGILFGAIVPPL